MEKHDNGWKWAPIAGRWSFADGVATFDGPEDQSTPVGLCSPRSTFAREAWRSVRG